MLPTKTKPKPRSKRKPLRSGVTIKTNRDGSIALRSFGPDAPDLRDVVPGLFAGTKKP